jgi:hypothetical protein
MAAIFKRLSEFVESCSIYGFHCRREKFPAAIGKNGHGQVEVALILSAIDIRRREAGTMQGVAGTAREKGGLDVQPIEMDCGGAAGERDGGAGTRGGRG